MKIMILSYCSLLIFVLSYECLFCQTSPNTIEKNQESDSLIRSKLAAQDIPPPPPPPPPIIFEHKKRRASGLPHCDLLPNDKEFESCIKKEMICFIYENLEYPEDYNINCYEGMAVVQFLVYSDGSICNIRIVRGIADVVDNAIINSIEKLQYEMNYFIPQRRSSLSKVQYTLPIKINW